MCVCVPNNLLQTEFLKINNRQRHRMDVLNEKKKFGFLTRNFTLQILFETIKNIEHIFDSFIVLRQGQFYPKNTLWTTIIFPFFFNASYTLTFEKRKNTNEW